MPEFTYFKNAMEYYRKKFPRVVFVVASDDREYVKKHFSGEPDVFLGPGTFFSFFLILLLFFM